MKKIIFAVFVAAIVQGCTGLTQYPQDFPSTADAESGKDPQAVLVKADPQFLRALDDITKASDPVKKRQIRNRFIEERLRIIDIRFKDFSKALVTDDVQVNLGASLLEIAVGATGAFVPETASQILSGASAALAGGIEAYNKVAFFDQAMPAMLAQMIANRKTILARIVKGMNSSVGEYSLIIAMQDLEDYYISGSIPGAIIATAKDAQNKNDKAQFKIDQLRISVFSEDESSKIVAAYIWPGGDRTREEIGENLVKLQAWIKESSLDGIPIQRFLDSKDLKSFRLKAIEQIPIVPGQ